MPSPTPILATKLYMPPLRPEVVSRPRLLERLNEGLRRHLVLISAPAGFGKTTLVSQWLALIERPAAWLSLDEGDNDPARFLTYLVAALQTIAAHVGEGVLGVLQSPQLPPTEAILTTLLNDLTSISDQFVLVFDDYHVIDAKAIDQALTFLLEQQPESVQAFLLRTSILERLCGPLCDAILLDSSASGQATLELLDRANLFIIPLDNERHWYRYHHLFADLLRQRLRQSIPGDAESQVNELYIRASQWFEDNGLYLEAFRHAAAAHEIERAERLMGGKGITRHFRGAVTTLLDWLESLPVTVLNSRPSLWWRHASLLLVIGQTTGVGEKLQAAEAAMHGAEEDDETRNLVGAIAEARATLALTRYQVEPLLVQSRRALESLHPATESFRARAPWPLGVASV